MFPLVHAHNYSSFSFELRGLIVITYICNLLCNGHCWGHSCTRSNM